VCNPYQQLMEWSLGSKKLANSSMY